LLPGKISGKSRLTTILRQSADRVIQYFKNAENQTIEVDRPENGVWVNVVPPFKEEEFIELSETLDIPIEFLRDSLDIDERPRYEVEDM